MNQRENYMAAMRGGVPQWIPNYEDSFQQFGPSIFCDPYAALYGEYFYRLENGLDTSDIKYTDPFGVTWVIDEYGPITEPGNILLEEIGEWREKFKIPDPDSYDWEHQLQEDYKAMEPDKAIQTIIIGPFMQLVNAMGFENALIALIAEEDEVRAFLDALMGFLCTVLERTVSRVHVDTIQIFDDIANSRNLFMSPELYRDLIKPYHKQLIDAARRADPNIIVEIHCCGMCESVIDDFVEIGCNAWQPALPMNDLAAIKAKYGSRLTIVGGWDNVTHCKTAGMTEEDIRRTIRDCIDQLAPGGGYVFWTGGAVGFSETMTTRLAWANDEANTYGKTFYQK